MEVPLQAALYHADCRVMPEISDGSVDLVVTSPPYWLLKDYGSPGQIGFGQSLHEYLRDLARVWRSDPLVALETKGTRRVHAQRGRYN